MQPIRKTKYGRIILSLIEELYRKEVIETKMEELIIGEGNDFLSKEDWIDNKLFHLLEEGKEKKQ